MWRTGGFVACVAALVAACVVDDIDWIGKTCQDDCPNALTCVDGVCQKIDSLVYVTNFHVDWVTPNSIRWAWTLEGEGSNLTSYELVVTSPVSGASGVKTWTSSDNEELGGYQIKDSNGFDLVTGTITSELDPSTEYDASLVVTDVAGHTFTTGSVRAVTDVPRTARLIVFQDKLSPGMYTTPNTLQFSSSGGPDGGPSLLYSVPQGVPFTNLRVDGLKLQGDSSLTEKLFESAYVELWIRGVGTPTSSWSETWLRTLAPDGGECSDFAACLYHYPEQWLYHPDSSNARYRRVQIPLSRFSLLDANEQPVDGGALTLNVLQGNVFDELDVGCPYGSDAQSTSLAQIAIFW